MGTKAAFAGYTTSELARGATAPKLSTATRIAMLDEIERREREAVTTLAGQHWKISGDMLMTENGTHLFRLDERPGLGVEAEKIKARIEATPDLFAALTALLAKHDDRDGLSDLWPREAEMARAAIAKATRQ